MRFHVPNNELELYQEDREQAKEEERKKKKEAKKAAGEEEKKADESSDDSEDDMTAAKLFDQKIHKKANIGEFAGEIVASIQDLPMLIPRGNYSLDFYSNFAKLHGKTHDYKIMFKDIDKIFMLPKPDGVHIVYILHLTQPLRQGMTLHHFIALNLESERETTVRLNLTPEEITEKYGDKLKPEMEGKLYDILSSLFDHLVGIKKIIVPGDFMSSRDSKAVKCSVRAAEGYLYPLKSSLVFIHKPILYIRHSELKSVEFSRVGQGTTGVSRSFDITLTKLRDDTQITFLSIDKEEQKVLMSYFKASGIKSRIVDADGGHQNLDSDSGEEDAGASRRKRANKGDAPAIDADMDDDESEDDSDFADDGSDSNSDDGEDGEDEQSED